MASTVTRKRATQPRHRRGPRLGDLSLDEFRELMEDLIDARLAQWSDPDTGLELRPEITESIRRQRAEYAAGKRGKSLDEVAKRLGLD